MANEKGGREGGRGRVWDVMRIGPIRTSDVLSEEGSMVLISPRISQPLPTSPHLSPGAGSLRTLVVDEVDAALSAPETRAALERVLAARCGPEPRQTVFVSASLPQRNHFVKQAGRDLTLHSVTVLVAAAAAAAAAVGVVAAALSSRRWRSAGAAPSRCSSTRSRSSR